MHTKNSAQNELRSAREQERHKRQDATDGKGELKIKNKKKDA